MLTSQWVCRRCARALAQPLRRQLTRMASTDTQAANLPPALLARARSLAEEHAQLRTTLDTSFDAKAARRLGELSRVASALKDFEAAQSSIAELTALISSPDADAELRELATEEMASTNTKLQSLATALSATLTPRDPYAHMPCLLEIRPGPGGQEGRYFADAVFRMYRQYCARVGLRANTVKYETVDGAESMGGGSANESPLAEAVLEIQDSGAYEMFRCEAGMHRVQRVPTTEKSGRTHTSAVAVWVLPSFPENSSDEASEIDINDPNSDFYIDPKDVRSEKMRASGAGGQHVNKTESAIRLTHIPTNTVVSMQDDRSQHRNREAAWHLLRARVASQRREAREELARGLRNSVLAREKITRGDKIRTYNYNQDRCTDHRSGTDMHNLPDVLDGGESLQKLMVSAREWMVGRDIQALVAQEEAAAAARERGEDGDKGVNGNGNKKKR